jgi:acyl transferase domain-containing protein
LLRDGIEVTESTIDDVAEFDADFFKMSPREAWALDPRQRLGLELAWELLEDACVVPESLSGEQVAVYLGAMSDDYAYLTVRDAPHNIDHHSFTGISRGMIANRISYTFGLHGNSMIVDSGQSSSLVAVHLACESLRTGESPLAIAGGIHLNMADESAMLETEFGALSTSGHTYAFDERADGYVRSEGGGLVLLKPLRAALDDGDRIRAVIRGSATGNAGHGAVGLTVPTVSGQVDVIRRALSGAGLDAGDVHYVEAHGPGTEIGDPIEATALGEVFADRRHRPVSIGSVKTNIGHSGGAAGIAGLVKTVLAIEHAMIPPSLNYARPGLGIDPEGLGLRVNTALTPWPAEGPRRAGVSSFGMGGTNAHVIVEQGPAVAEQAVTKRDNEAMAWVLSARSQVALVNQAERLLARVGADEGLDPADVAWSLVTTRSVFDHRAVVVGKDRRALLEGLAALAAGEPAKGVVVGDVRSAGKTVFRIPAEESQWPGMGSALYDRFPVFAKAFDEAAEPAVGVALGALLRRWGIEPDRVVGDSVDAGPDAGPVSVVTMAKDRPEVGSLLAAVAHLFTAGASVEWRTILGDIGGRVVELPTYGFARQRFWLGIDGSGGREAPPSARRAADLAKRLRQLDPDDRRRYLVELVCSRAATVLAHSSGHDIHPELAFQDLGFDSMTGVELRNRLKADTGLALPRTLIFDHPTPTAVADHLARQLLHDHEEESAEAKIWSSLRRIPLSELRRTGLLDKLLVLAREPETSTADTTASDDAIDELSPEALIAMALESTDNAESE